MSLETGQQSTTGQPFTLSLLDGPSFDARWGEVELLLRRVFDGAEYIDEGFTVERPIEYTRAGIEGRLGPGMKHFLVFGESDEIIGGFFCIATGRLPGQTVCSEVGWVFVVPEVSARIRLLIIKALLEGAIDAWREAGFVRVESNFGTLLGSKAIGRRFGIVHEPTPENWNRWVKYL